MVKILDGYYAASEHALKLLQKIAIKVDVEDKELLMKIARTSMYSKLVSEDSPILSRWWWRYGRYGWRLRRWNGYGVA